MQQHIISFAKRWYKKLKNEMGLILIEITILRLSLKYHV